MASMRRLEGLSVSERPSSSQQQQQHAHGSAPKLDTRQISTTSENTPHVPHVARVTVAEAIQSSIELPHITSTTTPSPPIAPSSPHPHLTSLHTQPSIERYHYPHQHQHQHRYDSMDDDPDEMMTRTWDHTPTTWDVSGHITAFLTSIQQFRNDR